MNIRCIIVDDEAPARDELRYLLSPYSDIEVIGEADSAVKAISMIRNTEPDLVFLDIRMPGKDGFEVVKALDPSAKIPLFVFATAYDQYAVKAFEASALDYILKPLSVSRLAQTMDRIRKQLNDPTGNALQSQLASLLSHISPQGADVGKELQKISVEKNGRMRLLSPDEIVYCSYEDDRILVHTGSESLPIYGIATMDKLDKMLCSSSFFRAHRSLLINMDFIKEFSPWFNGKYCLIMKDAHATELHVSRARVKDFKQRLGI